MKFLLLLVALVGFVAAAENYCEVCDHIIKTAEKHFRNGVNEEVKLLKELQRECLRLVRHYGAQAAIHCDQQI
uniref:Saposin B-type domain-containing protein n=1 Tax=Steinernema glaseri TaxID=37863 RepID=A0A1I7YZU7_9BILA